jgi:Ribose/xylose/arabinose/galactoside ABC-type transport systems, permease components
MSANKPEQAKQIKISELSRFGIYIAFAIMCIFFATQNAVFLSPVNIINILRQVSFNAILAMGMTVVIITGGIDLSVGSVLALAAVVAASLVKANSPLLPVFLAVLIALAIGALCGFLSGLVITKGKRPPFIATLVMMTIARGVAQLYTTGRPVTGLQPAFKFIGAEFIFGIPVPIYIMALVTLVTYVILSHLRLGRYIYAVGGNEQSASASGIKVDSVKIFAYVFSGALSALVGVVLAARLNSATPILGQGYELDAIAAAVIGGTSMDGGRGNVIGTLVGALIIGTISNGLDILNVSAYWQQIIKGLIILIAVLLDRKD